MSCRLIINADDFGWSEGVNEGVAALHEEGLVTSTSLMVGAPAAAAAVERARGYPDLAVGLHAATVCAPAVLPRQEIPAITDDRGRLPENFRRAGVFYSCLPSWRGELKRELRAQFETFHDLGFPWSHVDSHLHMTLTPFIFKAVRELADEYPVEGLRVPLDDYRLYLKIDPGDAAHQRALAWQFSFLARRQRGLLLDRYVVPSFCLGIFRTGRLDGEYLARTIEALPDGLYELHCHPDAQTEGGRREMDALRSAAFRRALGQREVVLTTYTAEARRHSVKGD